MAGERVGNPKLVRGEEIATSYINIITRQRKEPSHQEKEVTNQREQVTRLKE